jgi:hypothetical protein
VADRRALQLQPSNPRAEQDWRQRNFLLASARFQRENLLHATQPRASQGGYCYHVLNRGNGRRTIFHINDDFVAFVRGEPPLDAGPVPQPATWLDHVNAAQTEAEVETLRACTQRRRPYGDSAWAERVARQLGLESSLRPRGRPRKRTDGTPSLFHQEDDQE